MSTSLFRPARKQALRALGGLALACGVWAAAVPAAPAATLPAYQIPNLGLVRFASWVEPIIDYYDTSTGKYAESGIATLSQYPPAWAKEGSFQLCCGTATVAPLLGFVQTSSTASGKVEVYTEYYDTTTGYYHVGLHAISDFAPADAAHGSFWLFGSVNGQPQLGYVQFNAYQHVAVHVDNYNPSTNTYTRVLDAYSDFPNNFPTNGTFQLFNGANGEPQLGYMQTAHSTASKVYVEVDNYNTSTGTYTRAEDASSDFADSLAADGSFWLFGSSNLQPELGYVKSANTASGTVEVSVDSYYNGSYVRRLDATSNFTLTYAPGGIWSLLIA